MTRRAGPRLPAWVQGAFRVGATLSLTSLDGEQFSTLIEDIGPSQLIVGCPLSRGEPVDFKRGDPVTGQIVRPEGILRFDTRVMDRQEEPVALLTLQRPSNEHIQIIQRRRSVRVPLLLTVRWRRVPGEDDGVKIPVGDGDGEWLEGTMLNFGGTGMCMITDEPLAVDERLELEVPFPQGHEQLLGRVVNQMTPSKPDIGDIVRPRYGIEFLEMDLRQQDRLYGYVFERQRELRQKGQE